METRYHIVKPDSKVSAEGNRVPECTFLSQIVSIGLSESYPNLEYTIKNYVHTNKIKNILLYHQYSQLGTILEIFLKIMLEFSFVILKSTLIFIDALFLNHAVPSLINDHA